MRSFLIAAAGVVAASALPLNKTPVPTTPFSFPLADGFPNPSNESLLSIEKLAGGTLPTSPPPATISAEGLTNFRIIAFNELSEVAFFSELLWNITNNVPGYEVDRAMSRDFVIESITAIRAQEELHTLNANKVLAHFGAEPIQPCKYKFPVSNFKDAIELAATFTDVVMGTLQDVTQIFAEHGDAVLTHRVAAIIGQEGEQEGFFRILQDKRPSESPFLTSSVRDFGFTALQSYVVPSSCPNVNTIPLKIFQPLHLLTPPSGNADSKIRFSFSAAGYAGTDFTGLSLVLINGQNLPVVETINVVAIRDGMVEFEVAFPFASQVFDGLTVAAVTKGKGPFASADDVALATVFGPAFIEDN